MWISRQNVYSKIKMLMKLIISFYEYGNISFKYKRKYHKDKRAK